MGIPFFIQKKRETSLQGIAVVMGELGGVGRNG
jgi:hypothetical protein